MFKRNVFLQKTNTENAAVSRLSGSAPKDRACRALAELWASSAPAAPAPSSEEIKAAFPKRWDIYGDLVLFSETSFTRSPIFREKLASDDFWRCLAAAFGVQRVALRGAVTQDDFRSSGVRLMFGESGIVRHRDNGVIYQ